MQANKHSIWICPKCKASLTRLNSCYQCENNHNYDISKYGYTNLILANKKHSLCPGDNLEMVNARQLFLNSGAYKPLLESLISVVSDLTKENCVIADIGCGTGYYINAITSTLINLDKKIEAYGIDISKDAVKIARSKDVDLAVASASNLPIADNSVDIALSIFAPLYIGEIERILKQSGYLITVSKGANHLYGLKSQLYENPYINDEDITETAPLVFVETKKVSYTLTLDSKEMIASLLAMTPYSHKTHPSAIAKLLELNMLSTEIEFLINIYKKN